jgi:hypothetical protein
MTTKKADPEEKATSKLERGRFARLLASGFVIEVTPSKKRSATVKAATKSKPAPPKA